MIRLAIMRSASRVAVLRFLRRGGDRIETDEGKENNRGAAHDAAKSARRERLPVSRVNHERAKGDDENHHRDLDQNDRRVGCRAFANSVNEDDGYRCHDQHRWKIERDGVAKKVWQNEWRIILRSFATLGELGCCGRWIRHQPKRKFYCAVTQAVEQLDEIIRPAFATAMLPTAYSRIKSQPMIQAMVSPRVA